MDKTLSKQASRPEFNPQNSCRSQMWWLRPEEVVPKCNHSNTSAKWKLDAQGPGSLEELEGTQNQEVPCLKEKAKRESWLLGNCLLASVCMYSQTPASINRPGKMAQQVSTKTHRLNDLSLSSRSHKPMPKSSPMPCTHVWHLHFCAHIRAQVSKEKLKIN